MEIEKALGKASLSSSSTEASTMISEDEEGEYLAELLNFAAAKAALMRG